MNPKKPGIPAALVILMSLLTLPLPVQSQKPAYTKRQVASSLEWKRGVSAQFDYPQLLDLSVPVFVRTTIMSSKEALIDKAGIKAVVVENRSGKAVVSIRLRWIATANSDRMERKNVFGQGLLDAQGVYISEGEKAELNVTMPQMSVMLKRWFAEYPAERVTAISIGVSEVVFDDGSTWKAVPIG
jgi:hypothetical protein